MGNKQKISVTGAIEGRTEAWSFQIKNVQMRRDGRYVFGTSLPSVKSRMNRPTLLDKFDRFSSLQKKTSVVESV